jgi:hypothetical protein
MARPRCCFGTKHPCLIVTPQAQTRWRRRRQQMGVAKIFKAVSGQLDKPLQHYQFGEKLIEACQQSLLASPDDERFTQTGIAWLLRYMLVQTEDRDAALEMIVRKGHYWNVEAKRSLIEKLNKTDPRRQQILTLGEAALYKGIKGSEAR